MLLMIIFNYCVMLCDSTIICYYIYYVVSCCLLSVQNLDHIEGLEESSECIYCLNKSLPSIF